MKSPRLHHAWIDPHALEIVKTLQKKGHTTYLVGGCVRDLLLGKEPKDFDIATMAIPKKVKDSIPYSYVIGKRFRLVLVKRGSQQYEVATFRKDISHLSEEEMLTEGDNLFGSPEEDANRRDFTINGLFFDPINEELIDHTNGLQDLQNGIVRMIGDPEKRLIEDPIRILRAIRLAYMIRFQIDAPLKIAIEKTAHTLKETALPRRREEFLKFLRLKETALPFLACDDLGVLAHVSPRLAEVFKDADKKEEFLSYLHRLHHFQKLESPIELFLGLINAYVRTMVEPDVNVTLKTNDLLEHPELFPLMKDDLGLFKYEQKAICKALQLQSTLAQPERQSKTGRIFSIINSESFPLAVYLCRLEQSAPLSTLEFWIEEYKKALPQIRAKKQKREEQSKKRKRKYVKKQIDRK